LLSSEPNPEVCDATNDHSSTKAGQTIPQKPLKWLTFAAQFLTTNNSLLGNRGT